MAIQVHTATHTPGSESYLPDIDSNRLLPATPHVIVSEIFLLGL